MDKWHYTEIGKATQVHIDLRRLSRGTSNRVVDYCDHDRVNSKFIFCCLSAVVVPIFKFLCTNLKQEWAQRSTAAEPDTISAIGYAALLLLERNCASRDQVRILVLSLLAVSWLSREGDRLIEVWLYRKVGHKLGKGGVSSNNTC